MKQYSRENKGSDETKLSIVEAEVCGIHVNGRRAPTAAGPRPLIHGRWFNGCGHHAVRGCGYAPVRGRRRQYPRPRQRHRRR